MKKFLENNPLIHFTTVLTIIAIACGLVIGLVNFVTAPIIEANEIAATTAAYQEVLPALSRYEDVKPSNAASTIIEFVAAYDENDNLIGYIFKGSDTNGYGDMTVVLAIDVQGEIIGAQYLTLNQTLHLDRTRSNLELFIGTALVDVSPSGDLQGGATFSRDTTLGILTDMADAYESIDTPMSYVKGVELA